MKSAKVSCAALTAAVIGLTGLAACSDDKPGRPGPGATPSGGTAQPQAPARAIAGHPLWYSGRANLELLALDRTAGGTVTARVRAVQTGPGALAVGQMLSRPGSDRGFDLSGLSLVDGIGNLRYLPRRTADGKCVCSDLAFKADLKQGQSREYFVVFPAPPADVAQLTLHTPATAPFLDVPLGDRSAEQPSPGQVTDPATFAPPVILPLVSTVEGREQAVDQDDKNRRVRLSSDVLFALNKAELSPKADAVLARLAKDIDAATATDVKIDGYTDSSGNDAINVPLSKRRAAAVQAALEKLVTRSGVRFSSAGHGSGDPVASNDSDAGRRLNRRVTVSYPRPADKSAPVAPPSAPAGTTSKITINDRKFWNSVRTDGLDFAVAEVRRDSRGLVAVTWTVTNNGGSEWQPVGWGDSAYVFHYADTAMSAVRLTDRAKGDDYLPLKDAKSLCLCSMPDTALASGLGFVRPGETINYSVLYKVPTEVKSLVVQLRGFTPSQPFPV